MEHDHSTGKLCIQQRLIDVEGEVSQIERPGETQEETN